MALKKGKPGTKGFRARLKGSAGNDGHASVAGVLNYTPADRFGFTPRPACC